MPVEVTVVDVSVLVGVVAVEEVLVVGADEAVVVVVVSVTVPITQYDLVVSSPGQVMPGFSF